MSVTNWAENEIRIACKKERGNAPDGEWDYGVACYESAYKAYQSLIEDDHSGTSIGITKNILMRLIDGKPLTPIEDVPEVWVDNGHIDLKGSKSYQCNRMSSLFKSVYHDGTIKYSDVSRFICVNVNNPNSTYFSGLVRDVIDEMYPITMPYMPPTYPIKVYCEDFVTNPINGDFDTVGIFYIIYPDGKRVEVNKFFKNDFTKWEEISLREYGKRKGYQL